jgi:hypothetical protein
MYPPPLICPPDHYNTWREYDIEATSKSYSTNLSSSDLESLDAILDHIRILFPRSFGYIVDMFAHMFQKPSQKTGIALVINGAQGIGKNRLLDLIKLMMGATKCFETSQPDRHVYGIFNDTIRDKVLVIINSNSAVNQYLSAMIASKTFTWKAKRLESKTLESFSRFVITMNDPEFDASSDR